MAYEPSPEFKLWAASCEPAWEKLKQTREFQEELRTFRALSAQEQWLVALWMVNAQVVNGGFSQLYCNGLGWMAPSAMIGLRTIGLHEAAEVVELAHRTFQPEVDANDGRITDALEELSDRLSPQYWKLTENTLDCHVANYLRSRPQQP